MAYNITDEELADEFLEDMFDRSDIFNPLYGKESGTAEVRKPHSSITYKNVFDICGTGIIKIEITRWSKPSRDEFSDLMLRFSTPSDSSFESIIDLLPEDVQTFFLSRINIFEYENLF